LATGQLVSFFGAPELADSVVEMFGSRPEVTGDVRAMTRILSAQLDMTQGQWDSGITELRRARAEARGWALELEALYSGIPGRADRREAADAAHRAVEAWTPSPEDDSQNAFLHVHTGMHDAIRLYVLGLTDVWRGTPQEAADHLAELGRIPPTTSEGRLAVQLRMSLMAHRAEAWVTAMPRLHGWARCICSPHCPNSSRRPFTHCRRTGSYGRTCTSTGENSTMPHAGT